MGYRRPYILRLFPTPGRQNFALPSALKWMIDPAEQVDYTATIERTNEPGAPFAVIVTAWDGEEVARKRAKTEEEAQAFLELMCALLEWKVLQATGWKSH